MAMLLTILCMSLLVFAASCLAFTRAITSDEKRPELRPERRPEAEPRFFADVATTPTGLPRDILLMQLEKYVRLEQAAAESFLDRPTHEGLHSQAARLVH